MVPLPYIGTLIGSRLKLTLTDSVTTESGTPDIPTGLTAVWVDDFARLTVNDIPADVQIEWYESVDGVNYTLVDTTAVDVVTYDNYTWQNKLVYFKVRAKKGITFSDYTAAVTLTTPLVWKVDQSTPSAMALSTLFITSGKTVTVDWGDGFIENKTGDSTNYIHTYTVSANPYFIKLSGDVNFITRLQFGGNAKWYGDLTKWYLPAIVIRLGYNQNAHSGSLANQIIPASCLIYGSNIQAGNGFTGATPEIAAHPTNGLNYNVSANSLSSCGTTVFRKAMSVFNIGAQEVAFPTAEIDKTLASLVAFYTSNAPTANCTFTLNGANMGIPSAQGLSDRTALIGLYTAAGRTATVLVNS
jgi:hypothetical protein